MFATHQTLGGVYSRNVEAEVAGVRGGVLVQGGNVRVKGLDCATRETGGEGDDKKGFGASASGKLKAVYGV